MFSARRILHRTGLFFPLRSAYRAAFNRGELRFERRMREFYAKWIERGDVVFDVGANHGMYSDTFSSLGAQVIAIEPNPALWNDLDIIAGSRDIIVERCAVGESTGKARMRLYDVDAFGTISTEQKLSVMSQGANVVGEIEVDVVTLDLLASKYGKPAFVKIDAEGYDEKVLRGASFRPAGLSFEFSRDNSELSMRCFDAPILRNSYEFNVMASRDMEYASKSWMTASEIRSRIVSLLGNEEFGDIIARRI
jgi:FkbM family methyltransferase